MTKSESISVFRKAKIHDALATAVCVCILLLVMPQTVLADFDVYIEEPSIQRLRIAIPEFRGSTAGGTPELGRDLTRIVENDLELSGYFMSIDRDAFLPDAAEDVARDLIRFRDWTLIGAELLLSCSYSTIGNSLELEARLYDVFRGRRIYTKRLLGKVDKNRELIHRLSNEILYLLTGQKGIFLSKIAYVNRLKGKKDYYKEIFICDVDGYNTRQITFDKSIAMLPRFSPSGEKLLYNSYKDGGPMLYLKDLTTGVDSRISSRSGLNIGACWASDSKSIALALSHGENPDIYRIDLKGNILNRYTKFWGIDVSPSFSPDGRKMAFVSNRSGSPQIYVLDLETGAENRITYDGKYNTSPNWSKRDVIAFAGMNDGSFDIFTVRPDGSNLRCLTNGKGKNEDPCWSPDGRYIVFTSNRAGGYHLYLMTAGGLNQRRITFGKGEQTSPSWSPY